MFIAKKRDMTTRRRQRLTEDDVLLFEHRNNACVILTSKIYNWKTTAECISNIWTCLVTDLYKVKETYKYWYILEWEKQRHFVLLLNFEEKDPIELKKSNSERGELKLKLKSGEFKLEQKWTKSKKLGRNIKGS